MSESKIIGEAYGFDDLLLRPQRSDVRSRYSGEISTTTRIARGVPEIYLPVISANMDTVTEWRMAQEMALFGGIGAIHRFMTIPDQVSQVRKVKERLCVIEDRPPIIHPEASIQEALNILKHREKGYIIVTTDEYFRGNFIGIATTRDFRAGALSDSIFSVMTERSRIVTVPEGTTLNDAVEVMKKHRLEKIPIISSDGLLVGVYTLQDFDLFQQYPHASLDSHGRLMVAAAIGVQENEIERAFALQEAGVDVLILDIAHGELDYTQEMLDDLKLLNELRFSLRKMKVKERLRTPVIAGNVATKEGTLYVYDSGADGVKVGIGPSLVCWTRDVAGVGVPQATAIMESREAQEGLQDPIPLIGDGAIRKPGDLPKGVGCGFDAGMVGTLLAGTDESPGEPEEKDGGLVKRVRGMASKSAFKDRQRLGITTTKEDEYVPEGGEILTPYKGKVEKVLTALRGGLLSGMSYVGAHSIKEMQEIAQFSVVRNSSAPENKRPLQ